MSNLPLLWHFRFTLTVTPPVGTGLRLEASINSKTRFRLGKVDPVLAVGIWVGFGPELGSEKNRPK